MGLRFELSSLRCRAPGELFWFKVVGDYSPYSWGSSIEMQGWYEPGFIGPRDDGCWADTADGWTCITLCILNGLGFWVYLIA